MKYKLEMNVAIKSESNDDEKLEKILWNWVRKISRHHSFDCLLSLPKVVIDLRSVDFLMQFKDIFHSNISVHDIELISSSSR